MRDDWHVNRDNMKSVSWRDEELSPSSLYSPIVCTEINDGRSEVEVDVIVEESFRLYLDDSHITTFVATPDELRELAIGHLICEGFIDSAKDIASIEIENDLIECVSKKCTSLLDNSSSDVFFDRNDIFRAISHIKQDAKLWRRTGGTHSSIVLSSKGEIISFCEDISRSCSVDKAVGKAALGGSDLSQCAIVTTGRLSVTMVSKALNAGLSMMASKAAPVREGVMLAREKGVTLVAFARDPYMYVYSADERII